jgi:hypothetical protein
MAFEEVNPGIWTPENEDDSITGVFVRAESDVGQNKSMIYHLEIDGKPLSVWGCAILDQRMIAVRPGDKVRITYKGLGEKAGGKNAPKIFKVEIDRPGTSSSDPGYVK